MAKLAIEGITKQFGDVRALNSFSLEVADGEFITLLGPSGCGKSTALRCVAGFEQPEQGRVRFGDRDVSNLPPEQRDVGMVFQNYALFPHLTVRQNLAFGLEMRRIAPAEVDRRVKQVIEKVQLGGREARYPRELSGGQQQRVALARALVIEPLLLLLDEPLANLDAILRDEMRVFIRSLQREVGITALYVTHDQAEAMVMSDRVVVMFDGRIAQIGAPEAIYHRPRSKQVANFIGRSNFVPVTVQRRVDPGRFEVASPFGTLTVGGASDQGRELLLRPESIRLRAPTLDAPRLMIVRERYFHGATIEYLVALNDATYLAQSGPEVSLAIGDRAQFTVDETNAWLILGESATSTS